MRRHDLRSRFPRFLAAALLLTAGLLPAQGGAPADERPPLLAQAQAPEGRAAAARLLEVGVDPAPDGTYEVTIRGDGGVPYQLFALKGPDRLILDLPGLRTALPRPRVEVSQEGLLRVRVGQYLETPEPVARVVFDLDRPLTWTVDQNDNTLVVRLASSAPGQAPVPAPAGKTAARTLEPPPEAVTAPPPAERPDETPRVPEAAPLQAPAPPPPVPAVTMAAAMPAPRAEPSAPSAPPSERPAPVQAADIRPAAVEPWRPEPAPAARIEGNTPAPEPPVPAPLPAETWQAAPPAEILPPAAPAQDEEPVAAEKTPAGFTLPDIETKRIEDNRRTYSGDPISLELVDADIKQVFGMFHELSGLNFVLDPAVSGAVTIVVDQIPWDQALDLVLKNNNLDMVLEGTVVRIAPITKLAQEAAQRKQLFEAKELEQPPVTISRVLSYAKARDIERVVRDAILSPRGKVIVDERTNTLIIRDIPARVEAIDKLLTTLDAETPQVMIEARIVEVSRDFVHSLGINWGFLADANPSKGTQTSLQFPHRAKVKYALNLPKNPTANSLGFSFGNVLDSFTLDVTLDALETEGYARRLSAPKIAAQNNQVAEIEQGVRLPIATTTATEIDVTFVSASLRLRCTPQITAEGTVVLDIEVENNSVDFVNQTGDVPPINTQRAQTKVLIPDGGTTVIAGIFSVNEGRDESGVPWFRSLPGLGWLFRSKQISTRNRELLIFITPRIIKAA